MARSIDADLVVDVLAEGVQDTIENQLPSLRAFSTDFGADRMAPGRTVQVEKVVTAGTAQTNPTDYEVDTTTANTNVAVSLSEYSRTWTITAPEAMDGHKLLTKSKKNAAALGNTIWDLIAALLVNATYTNTMVTVAEASFAATHRSQLYGSLSGAAEKHLVLSGLAYGTHLPTDKNSFDLSTSGAFGWAGLHEATSFSGSAESNLYGMACAPNAVAVAAALPVRPPGFEGDMIASEVVTIDGLGLSVEVTVWFSRQTRALWAGYSVMFGAAAGDIAAATLITSA